MSIKPLRFEASASYAYVVGRFTDCDIKKGMLPKIGQCNDLWVGKEDCIENLPRVSLSVERRECLSCSGAWTMHILAESSRDRLREGA